MEGFDVMRYLLDTSPWANNVLIPEVIPARIQKLLAGWKPRGFARSAFWNARFITGTDDCN
jgi:hypothetical protein